MRSHEPNARHTSLPWGIRWAQESLCNRPERTRVSKLAAAEAPFADLQEAAYDYAGLQRWPLLGKTLFAPGAWSVVYRGERLAGFPASEVSSVAAVQHRAFPLLLICDGADVVLPCRHSEKIFRAAAGAKQLWRVPGALHTGAIGAAPEEFRHRVIVFFDRERFKPGEPAPSLLCKSD
jgi:pimeloyl-ACP methyl ester carboxylesterase